MSLAADNTLFAYMLILLVGVIPTNIWRWSGVFLATNITEDSEIFIWVRAVATALVAGVIAQLVILPTGALAEAPLAARVSAFLIGFCLWWLTGRKILVGVLTAEVLLALGWYGSLAGWF